MLYGDDDTLFFVDSISELLQDFDPSLPYIITGMGLTQKTLANSDFDPSLPYIITGMGLTQKTLANSQCSDHVVRQDLLQWVCIVFRVLWSVSLHRCISSVAKALLDASVQKQLDKCQGAMKVFGLALSMCQIGDTQPFCHRSQCTILRPEHSAHNVSKTSKLVPTCVFRFSS